MYHVKFIDSSKKEKTFCHHCFNELKTLIAIRKFTLIKKDGYWEAKYDDEVKFFCPYCNLEVDIDKLGIKEVIF
jgi:hypothetical protein